MKMYPLWLISIFFSLNVLACEQNDTEVISCSLPGVVARNISFCLNSNTQKINYYFKKEGRVELNVLFDSKRKLKRLTDKNMGVTYFGFSRGEYSYILNIINGMEAEEYSMSFDIKKEGKIIQSNDCLSNSYRNSNIVSKYIDSTPYSSVKSGDFIFP